jgi:hypothetical protein
MSWLRGVRERLREMLDRPRFEQELDEEIRFHLDQSAALGILAGVGISVYGARWLQALVFGVSPHDPLTLLVVAIGLGTIAFAACALPAISATRIDPAITLKSD